jgi:hypothetical protein
MPTRTESCWGVGQPAVAANHRRAAHHRGFSFLDAAPWTIREQLPPSVSLAAHHHGFMGLSRRGPGFFPIAADAAKARFGRDGQGKCRACRPFSRLCRFGNGLAGGRPQGGRLTD